MAMILISHDLGVVAGVADRLAVMYAGRIVESGPIDDVFAAPRMPYTAGLLRATPRLDASGRRRLQPIRGTPPEPRGETRACRFAPRCDLAQPPCLAGPPRLIPIALGSPHEAACHFADAEA